MALTFPSSPTNGQTYTYSGTTYTYDGKRWVATTNTITQASTTVTTSSTAPSNPATGQMWLNSDTGTIAVYALGGWVAVGSVNSTIAANSVIADMLASNAVTTAKINDSAVTTTKIADTAVTTAKINDGAITRAKLDTGLALPIQTTHTGQYLTTDGTNASWATVPTTPASVISAKAVGYNLVFGG